MNIFSAEKKYGRFALSFDILGGLAFGCGLSFYPHVIAFGVSLGPFVLGVSYTQPNAHAPAAACVGGSCPTT